MRKLRKISRQREGEKDRKNERERERRLQQGLKQSPAYLIRHIIHNLSEIRGGLPNEIVAFIRVQ